MVQTNHRNGLLYLPHSFFQVLYSKFLFNKITIQTILKIMTTRRLVVAFFTLRHTAQALVFARCIITLRTMR